MSADKLDVLTATEGNAAGPTEPPVIVDEDYFDRLYALATGTMQSRPEVAQRLLDELDRATVLPAAEMPGNVVDIGSEVTYRDEDTGREQTVSLVFPVDADIDKGRVSVLTPIGAALLGLAEGHRITWQTRQGESRSLEVLKVVQGKRG